MSEEAKNYIVEALDNFVEVTKKQKTLEIQDTDQIVEALNFAYTAIENLEKDLDFARKNSYNYMEKYTWLLAHCPPKAVAIAAGFPWNDLEAPQSVNCHMNRIDQYAEWGIQNLKTTAEVQLDEVSISG